MKNSPEKFDLKTNKFIPIDEFVDKALYHPEIGYYTKKISF
jgi:Uncharacterized conserved protein